MQDISNFHPHQKYLDSVPRPTRYVNAKQVVESKKCPAAMLLMLLVVCSFADQVEPPLLPRPMFLNDPCPF